MSKRKSYEVAFKLKVVDYAEEQDNRPAERKYGVSDNHKLGVRPVHEYIRYHPSKLLCLTE